MSNFLFLESRVINTNHILFVDCTKIVLKTGESICTSATSQYGSSKTAGLLEIPFKDESEYNYVVQELINIMYSSKDKAEKYKRKYEQLKLHISLMPGGQEYLVAKNDFNQNANIKDPKEVTK